MVFALKRLALVQCLLLIWDEAALQRLAKVIEQEAPEVGEEDDLTDVDIAELDKRRARRLSAAHSLGALPRSVASRPLYGRRCLVWVASIPDAARRSCSFRILYQRYAVA